MSRNYIRLCHIDSYDPVQSPAPAHQGEAEKPAQINRNGAVTYRVCKTPTRAAPSTVVVSNAQR